MFIVTMGANDRRIARDEEKPIVGSEAKEWMDKFRHDIPRKAEALKDHRLPKRVKEEMLQTQYVSIDETINLTFENAVVDFSRIAVVMSNSNEIRGFFMVYTLQATKVKNTQTIYQIICNDNGCPILKIIKKVGYPIKQRKRGIDHFERY